MSQSRVDCPEAISGVLQVACVNGVDGVECDLDSTRLSPVLHHQRRRDKEVAFASVAPSLRVGDLAVHRGPPSR